jgi:hypothetical protein
MLGMLNLNTCASCEFRSVSTCTKNRRNVFSNALSAGCPIGRFGPSSVVAGAVGLTKAALHIGRATDEVISSRRAICAACPNAEDFAGGIVTRCKLCRCILEAKVLNAGQKCPDHPPRW